MAKKEKDAAEGAKAKSKKIPAIIVAVAVLGAAYMLGPGKAKPAPAAGSTPTTTTTILGAVAGLDAITLNLADGRYLKVAIALQLKEPAKAGATAADATDKSHWARALDATISVLGERTYADLSAPGGRAKAKDELSQHVADLYKDEVTGVYFTEFVMQ
jgi:flagellar FliL protein